MKNKIRNFKEIIKKNPITTLAVVIAIITMFFVPIDMEYLNYFDTRTLFCLFCILGVVQCLKQTNFFNIISKKIIFIFKNNRSLILSLILLTFICDLFLANDMSLITLLPLTYIVLKSTNNMKYYAFTLIMQNIAANMSGMITPHGNPQNLYLYSFFNIPTVEFIKILLPQFFVVLFLLVVIPLFIKNEPLKLVYDEKNKINKKEIMLYLSMFVFSLLIIFRVVPYILGTIIIFIFLFIYNPKALKELDWDLLLTFVAFFIFSNNLRRIPAIYNYLSKIINNNVLLTGIISCQFISNVPTAILLSKFTTNYRELLISVNIGSLGSLISSLASLITLKEFLKNTKKEFGKYIIIYSLINLLFFIILFSMTLIIDNII